MNITDQLRERLVLPAYPRSAKYDAGWMLENEMGPNALWLCEWLCDAMALEKGMRVLDMGCGRAMTSIFLAREFGVQVWAVDLWIGATENWERVREAGVDDLVFPLHCEAHDLPFAEGFFDAAVSVDSYHYYGTDDHYLGQFVKLLKPGAQLGVVLPALTQELGDVPPDHFTRPRNEGQGWWDPAECGSIHTLDWWRRHWTKTQLADIETADALEDGWREWALFEQVKHEAGTARFPEELDVLLEDEGRYLGLIRLVARCRRQGAQ